jgi:hypothetical protein
MRRLRMLLTAVPIAAVLAVCGLTAGAPQASAFVTIGDQCGSYFSNYWWWGNEYLVEYESAGYETSYAAYAYTRVQFYGNLIQSNNC